MDTPDNNTIPDPVRSPHARMLDDTGHVAVDAPCLHCGYNLRTMAADAVCPECGKPVGDALNATYLRFAEPRWVRSLATGTLVILISLGAAIVVPPIITGIAMAIAMATSPQSLTAPSTNLIQILTVVRTIAGAIPTAITIVGIYMLTRPEPPEYIPPDARRTGNTARRGTRVVCWMLLLPLFANLYLGLTMPPLPTVNAAGTASPLTPAFVGYMANAMLVGVISIACMLPTPIFVAAYYTTILRRIPNMRLARFARIEYLGMLLSGTLFTIGMAVLNVGVAPTMRAAVKLATTAPATAPAIPTPTGGRLTAIVAGGISMGFGGLALLALSLAAIIIMIMACTALYRTAAEARANAVPEVDNTEIPPHLRPRNP